VRGFEDICCVFDDVIDGSLGGVWATEVAKFLDVPMPTEVQIDAEPSLEGSDTKSIVTIDEVKEDVQKQMKSISDSMMATHQVLILCVYACEMICFS